MYKRQVYPKVGELVGLGSPIMSISIMSDMGGTFNVREDHLKGLNKGDEFTAYVPAFNKDIKMKVLQSMQCIIRSFSP